MLDVVDFIAERGGNPEKIRESQRRRYANVEIVDEIIALFDDHRKSEHAGCSLYIALDRLANTKRFKHQPTIVLRRSTGKSTTFRSRLEPRRRFRTKNPDKLSWYFRTTVAYSRCYL